MTPAARVAIFFAILTSLLLAGTGPATRLVSDSGYFIPSFLGIRSILVGIILAVIVKITLGHLPRLNNHGRAFAIAATINMLISIGYLFSVAFIPVTISVILLYTFPFFLIAHRVFFLKEKVSPIRLLLIAVVFIGIAITVGPQFQDLDIRGILLALMGGASFAAYLIALKAIPADEPRLAVISITQFGAGLLITLGVLIFAPGTSLIPPPTAIVPALICLIIFGGGMIAQLFAITREDPLRLAVYFNLEPMLAIGLSAFVLGEILQPLQYFGACLVIAAVMASAWLDMQGQDKGA